MQMCMAKQKRTRVFQTSGIPVALTLADVKMYNSGRLQGPGQQAPAQHGAPAADVQQPHLGSDEKEDTQFLGKELRKRSVLRDLEVRNAVGFFMYVTCQHNTYGTWPETLGALPSWPVSVNSCL